MNSMLDPRWPAVAERILIWLKEQNLFGETKVIIKRANYRRFFV